MPFPYIFTFYSYKGGVGRSMALMNVAYTLVGRGRHVLIVDMDLEAPGVSSFLQHTGEFAPPQSAHPKDILTLLDEAIRVKADGGPLKEKAKNLPPLSHYIRTVAEEKLEPLKPQLGKLGRLDVLGTDLERNYNERLAQLGIRNLPPDRLLALSSLLHHYFKQQVFPFRPLGVEDFEPAIETPYDYVLVDSRTGVTEIGGLCIGPLADRLVVLTGLNDQNVEGTLSFMLEAGIQPRVRSEKDEPWDDADTVADNPSLGPKPTILVASPVPAGEIGYKRQRLSYLQDRLGIRPLLLSYHPQQALMETNFVRDLSEEFLAHEYRNLGTTLMAQVGDNDRRLASRVERLTNARDFVGAIACALRLASDNSSMGTVALGWLSDRTLDSSGTLPPEMVTRMHATLSQDAATRLQALNNWGSALSERAKNQNREDADRLFEEAERKYAEAILLSPEDHGTLNNLGAALYERAKAKEGSEADRLFEDAANQFAEAIRLKPDFADALNNLGNALYEMAKTRTMDEADRLLEEANRRYAEAIRWKPGNTQALYNWANALSERARNKQGREADHLFEEADRRYAEAVLQKPDLPEVFNNWGSALYDRAATKQGEEADRLFEEAGSKFAQATRLEPDYRAALSNWALVLSHQATTKEGEQAAHLGRQAGQRLLDVARLDAKQGDPTEAAKSLQSAASLDPTISKSQLLTDPAFEPLRNHPDFLALLESLAP